jgi:hypothetical protein
MLQVVTFIKIEQCTNISLSDNKTLDRDKIFYFTLFEDLEISKSIDYLIQTAKIILPKRFTGNIFKRFQGSERGIDAFDNTIFSDGGELTKTINTVDYNNLDKSFVKNVDSIKGVEFLDPAATATPLFNRGDMITVYMGYLNGNNINSSNNPLKLYQQYQGYIASISSGENIELLCEDFMWYFKQLRIPNKSYPVNLNLSTLNLNSGEKISYVGLGNSVVKNIDGNYVLVNIVNSDSNPQSYSKNTLPGILLDVLNNTINDQLLIKKGIYPLIWNTGAQKVNGVIKSIDGSGNFSVPKPNIVLANQPIRSAGNINIVSNATVYTLFDVIKSVYNQNVYFLQQSSASNVPLGRTDEILNLPTNYIFNKTSNAGYPGNYLNIGYSQYVPQEVYQPRLYDFYLNGPSGNVLKSNLCWKRQEDFLMGAIIKSTQIVNDFDPISGVEVNTTTGNPSKKTKSSNVVIGDIGGSIVTYYYSSDIDLVYDAGTNTYNLTGAGSTNKLLPGSGSLYDMAKFGYERLNSIHYTGYYGSITTFGYPFVNIGDIVNIIDPLYPERQGNYKVKGVILKSNKNIGIEQEIFLHYQVNYNKTAGQYEILKTTSNTAVYYTYKNKSQVYSI